MKKIHIYLKLTIFSYLKTADLLKKVNMLSKLFNSNIKESHILDGYREIKYKISND